MGGSIKNLRPTYGKFQQGYYTIQKLEKYIGNPLKCIYRSSWERCFMVWADLSDRVLKWSSEPFPIQYFSPIDKLMHNYNIDFFIRVTKDEHHQDYLVEVKPKHQMKKPSLPKPPKNSKSNTAKQIGVYNSQCKTYITNCAKWAAAKQFAESRNMKFVVITEDFLFGRNKAI